MFRQERVTLQNPLSWRIGTLTSLLTLLLLLAGVSPRLAAQANEWAWMSGSNSMNQPGVYGTKGVPAAGNVPGGRYTPPVTWTDAGGNFWLFGGSNWNNGSGGDMNDLWKYTPSTGEWTWMSGSNSLNQPGVYGTLGVPAAANVPGARDSAVSWTDANGNLWLFGGHGYAVGSFVGKLNDLWKHTPSTGEWTWMGGSNALNQPGVYGTKGVPAAGNVPGARSGEVSWTDANGNLWLFGGGDENGNALNDLWKYTLSTGEWTWIGGSNTVNQPGVYGTLGVPAAGNVPGARGGEVSWTDANGNLWLFGGDGYDANGTNGTSNDLWKYTPSTGEWTWMSGGNTNTPYQRGVNGTLGVSAAGNVPIARDTAVTWTDSRGNLWLFGGMTNPPPDEGVNVGLNDLWMFTPSTGWWTWMGAATDGPGVYGTLGVPAAGNVPGIRQWAVGWTDASGNLWLFGGYGFDACCGFGDLNDLWEYTPAPPPLPPSLTTPAPGSTLPGSTATFAWSNPGNLAARFVLRLGTTFKGSTDVYSGGANTGTTEQVSAIPANGAYLYARLWYYLNGKWQYTDSIYKEAGTPTLPAFTAPAPGSTLPGSTVTFGWNPGEGATRFVLRLGTAFKGSTDVYSGQSTTGTSVQLTTIPTNGATLYARLWYYLNETWKYVDAIYTEASK
jgi:N-acetylneuraminic acid mutarotase